MTVRNAASGSETPGQAETGTRTRRQDGQRDELGSVREAELGNVHEKADRHCHFRTDPMSSEKRGWALDLNGRWEADHVIQPESWAEERAADSPSARGRK
jgi:hypothetical protein